MTEIVEEVGEAGEVDIDAIFSDLIAASAARKERKEQREAEKVDPARQWTFTSIVLREQEVICQCCGHVQLVPVGVFLRKERTFFKEVSDSRIGSLGEVAEHLRGLPRLRDTVSSETVALCGECFEE